jgi:hypothetical protein
MPALQASARFCLCLDRLSSQTGYSENNGPSEEFEQSAKNHAQISIAQTKGAD